MSGSYLGDDGQLRTQVVEANVCHIEAVDADFPLRRFQDAEQAEGHGRLAGPRAAHDPHLEGVRGPSAGGEESAGGLARPPRLLRRGTCWRPGSGHIPRTPRSPRAPSRRRARADSGSSAPAPGRAGSAWSSSGTPPRPAGASPPEGGCPPPPKGPGHEGKRGLHQGAPLPQPALSRLSVCLSPEAPSVLTHRGPWGRVPGVPCGPTLWFNESFISAFIPYRALKPSHPALSHSLLRA